MKKSYEESKDELNSLYKLGKIDKEFYNNEIKKLDVKIKQREEIKETINREKRNKKITITLVTIIITITVISLIILINGQGILYGRQYEKIGSFESIPVPTQKKLSTERVETVNVMGKDYKVKLIYEYTVYGKVVGTLDYDYQTLHGSVVPKDVGLVFGPLAQKDFLKHLKFESRYIKYIGKSGGLRVLTHTITSAEGREILTNMGYGSYISNNHILGCDERVNKLIDEISVGDCIKIEGYLCEVTGSYDQNVSATKKEEYTIMESDYEGRNNNDCETIYVTDVKWLKEK